jgi:hypothetical protein
MLSLRSFHTVFIDLSIVLASGFGVWGLLDRYVLLGAVSLAIAVLLVIYRGYFVWKTERIHLD